MPARIPARHELPDIDAAAFEAARALDRLLAEASRLAETGEAGSPAAAGADRWAGYLQRLPDQLRDEPLPGLRIAARRVRAAYGPKDSVREVFGPELTEPLLDATDRLLRAIARHEAHRT